MFAQLFLISVRWLDNPKAIYARANAKMRSGRIQGRTRGYSSSSKALSRGDRRLDVPYWMETKVCFSL